MNIIFDNLQAGTYDDSNIITLEGFEHIRRRPGMYIGKLGDGKHSDDGIYVLLKEVLDNSIDEFRMNSGKNIEVRIDGKGVEVRDYGRGIPLGTMIEAVSRINTRGIYDPKAFKKHVGGTRVINALSERFVVQSFRDGKTRRAEFKQGKLVSDSEVFDNKTEKSGTYIAFEPDDTFFQNFVFKEEYIETMLRNYSYFNTGLNICFNDKKFFSKDGLLDLLNETLSSEPLYPIIHLKGEDIEIAFTHSDQYGEEYYSFVNGQHTTQGGTHQSAFRKSLARTIKEFYTKTLKIADIRNGIIATIAINIEDPVFESQTKTKLGSRDMLANGVSVKKYISDFLKKELYNYMHRNTATAELMLQKILESKRERGK